VSDRALTQAVSDAILIRVEKQLQGMFENGVVMNVTADDTADEYVAKANTATDPALAAGYRKLARKHRKKRKRNRP